MKLTVTIEKGVNCFGASVEELPGCFAAGHTLDELKESLLEAIEITADTMMEMGEDPINTNDIEFYYKTIIHDPPYITSPESVINKIIH